MRGIFGLLFAGIVIAQPVMAQTAPLTGEEVFKQRCAMCHSVVKGKPSGVGPNLAGIVGRASAKGTFAYSPALTTSKIVWTNANLDKYLAAPTKMVNGTRMIIALGDAKQRKAVISYLATIK